MYHPASRLLTLLEVLQAEGTLGGRVLARRLEVDVRTVRRYVTILQDMGVPIEATVGRVGGYRLRPGYKLPPLMLTDDEAVAVTLGLLVVDQLGLDGSVAAAAGALAKVQRVLPAALGARVGALAESLVLDLAPAATRVARAVLGTLASAVQLQRQVQLVYHAARGTTERALDPYGVVFQGGRWYTVGYCHLRGDVRVFRLDRIGAAALRPEGFSKPAGFDSKAYLQEAIARIPDVYDVAVLLDLDLEVARQRCPPGLALLEAAPPYVRLRASVDDLELLARALVGLGCRMIIEQPPALRQVLREMAGRLLDAAADPTLTARTDPPTHQGG